MLQQTRIAAVMPYYERFLTRFPTFSRWRARRSRSPEAVVRSRLLQPRAQSASRRERKSSRSTTANSRATSSRAELPGIGTYTAAAVLSIAYDVPLAVLDGNVARVLARLDAIRGDLRAPTAGARSRPPRKSSRPSRRRLESGADGTGRSDLHAADLRAARCVRWRAAAGAYARRPDRRDSRAAPKTRPGKLRIAAAILLDPRGRTLLVRDPGAHDDVLFSRMWQFPAIEVTRDPQRPNWKRIYAQRWRPRNSQLEELPAARHGVTFRNITLLPFLATRPQTAEAASNAHVAA